MIIKHHLRIRDASTDRQPNKIADLMMLKFGESEHPVFRATSPLSRGQLKSKGGGKLSSVFTEQSQKCVKNMNLFMTER